MTAADLAFLVTSAGLIRGYKNNLPKLKIVVDLPGEIPIIGVTNRADNRRFQMFKTQGPRCFARSPKLDRKYRAALQIVDSKAGPLTREAARKFIAWYTAR